ncbi:MAG: CcoQ/FixQ family Cbb3-type cytochrome c oxidase assembly chaperone [Flavobacteriales bacterium]|jgi:NhaP-type Na+/H+ or K+/H+ antiporter|nr:CcoQ/FixQ family Cbb3-type cytochrome c oxidase assembly chaperone [Flavobacteriales bacterium]MBT3963137.1 CcoQ/FixQ family Cbb3-type cytochrome c oxidase assembly chaperone [Flavobacteriales bacterium]MBT4705962.1 CcoQ/FixQ family Cbb3-type cytochrome c oxidase assembly chaperone [Flavobacteriales bacterium]MBT4931516.1 CcoQ/FixQ family Cbb3-type cytochrome c oxidase assembly chaperone [Flavobacteriales bacterium]MBT5131628.1 CcoQ/FixQ family Cbb3-type cytochrome c oxidase assembly chapero
MLKFVKHHMETIAGIEIYPLVSFVIFFTFFLSLFAYVMLMKKNHIKELENIPLTDND